MKTIVIVTICVNLVLSSSLRSKVPLTKKGIGGRIVWGEKALPGQFPWIAAVYTHQIDENRICGGALINDRWVLTAATCVQYAKIYRIQLGSSTLSFEDGNRISLTSRYGVVHPNFDEDYRWHDIGLIRLDSPVTFTDTIKPIPLYEDRQLEAGVKLTFLSWGGTARLTSISNYLNFADYTTIDNESCNDIYGDVLSGSVCATSAIMGLNPCGGDTGGPAIVTDENGLSSVAGIFSYQHWTLNCPENDYPLVFTRVKYYLNWINNVTLTE